MKENIVESLREKWAEENRRFEISAIKFDDSPTTDEVAIDGTKYERPHIRFLKDTHAAPVGNDLKSESLISKLREFGIDGAVTRVLVGPLVTRYEIKLAPGVKLSQIRAVSEDLSVALTDKVRIQAPIPGTSLVGIEVPNKRSAIIGLKEIIRKAQEAHSRQVNPMTLPVAAGTDITGHPQVLDLATMPHLLVAGQTGSGKSIFLHSVILSILYTHTPRTCRLTLIDPKRVEMAAYKGLLGHTVITEPGAAVSVFGTLVREMERRYRILETEGCRNIASYNAISSTPMHYIVVVVDEMADLMMTSGKDIESCVVRLAQLARAVGIHLVLATQKPVVKVVTGLIKSNMPSRIAFQTASGIDSRVILDQSGAEKLMGRGDMLALYPGVTEPERLHGAYVSDGEINSVVRFLQPVERRY